MTIVQVSTLNCVVSPLNPRQLDPDHLTPEESRAIDELGESLNEHGMLEPCIGRKRADGKIELLVGQRRLLARRRMDRDSILVDVLELGDEEAVRVALTEQLQREDLHPLDEAEAYERIVKGDPETLTGAVQQLAESIGKSPTYVRKRLALRGLSPKAERAFRAGEIDLARAYYLARIPSTKVQEKVLTDATAPDHEGEVRSSRQLRVLVEEEHMHDLREAPFDLDDATLVPAAGICATCPKNTAQAPELFDDVKGDGVCTDEECYSSKCAANFQRRAGELLAKKKITKAIAPAESKKLFDVHNGQLSYGSGQIDLDAKKYDYASGGDKKWRTHLKAALDSGAIRPALAMRPDGTIAELVSRSAAEGVVAKVGSAASKTKADPKTKEKNKAARREQDANRDIAAALFRACIEAAAGKGEAILLRIAVDALPGYFSRAGDDEAHLVSPALKDTDDLHDRVAKLTLPELRSAVAFLALGEKLPLSGGEVDAGLIADAKLLGVDVKKVEKQVRAILAAKLPAPAPAKPAVKKGTTKRAKASTAAHVAKLPRGVCRYCGCTDDRACPEGCSWADEQHTICTACVP